MVSLEKKMFFIPNKLYAKKNKLFVSFNLSVIPKDMKVKSMELHLTLPKSSIEYKVYLREITNSWSEKNLKKGRAPSYSKALQTIKCRPGQGELLIDLLSFETKWRFKGEENHGINIVFMKRNIEYFDENPPFLIVDTI